MPTPTRIQCRSDLMQYVLKHAPVSAVRKAMIYGQQELLGWFTQLPPHGQAGWVIRVRSEYGRTWLVSVQVNGTALPIRVIERVRWRYFEGDRHGPGTPHRGDDPYEGRARRKNHVVEQTALPRGRTVEVFPENQLPIPPRISGTLRIGDDEGTVKL